MLTPSFDYHPSTLWQLRSVSLTYGLHEGFVYQKPGNHPSERVKAFFSTAEHFTDAGRTSFFITTIELSVMDGRFTEYGVICSRCKSFHVYYDKFCRDPEAGPSLSFLFYKPIDYKIDITTGYKPDILLREWSFFLLAIPYIPLIDDLKKRILLFIRCLILESVDWTYLQVLREIKFFSTFNHREHFSYLYKQLE
ncbi:MAG TPA: hypothetical protein VFP45_03480 [Candidatus Nitrosotalea sp.]|nr:hypothetical protein [Candidatus Nitrosotalea sp.]